MAIVFFLVKDVWLVQKCKFWIQLSPILKCTRLESLPHSPMQYRPAPSDEIVKAASGESPK